jgi:hypothetical protein
LQVLEPVDEAGFAAENTQPPRISAAVTGVVQGVYAKLLLWWCKLDPRLPREAASELCLEPDLKRVE